MAVNVIATVRTFEIQKYIFRSIVKLTGFFADINIEKLYRNCRESFFINGTETPRRPGELIHLPVELCNTYKLLAEKGGDDFYTGTLADLIADDLRDLGSIITKKDLELYK